MNYELITKQDLEVFRQSIINDFREILEETISKNRPDEVKGLKTKAATKLLNCSVNTLTSLVTKGIVRVKKVGGANYYSWRDVQKVLMEGFR